MIWGSYSPVFPPARLPWPVGGHRWTIPSWRWRCRSCRWNADCWQNRAVIPLMFFPWIKTSFPVFSLLWVLPGWKSFILFYTKFFGLSYDRIENIIGGIIYGIPISLRKCHVYHSWHFLCFTNGAIEYTSPIGIYEQKLVLNLLLIRIVGDGIQIKLLRW